MSLSKKVYVFIFCFIILVVSALFYFEKIASALLPPAKTYNAASTSVSVLPPEVNLQIPFTSQAPHQDWRLPYQQFCEEASTLMAASYINGQTILTPDNADSKMLAIKDFEMKKFGFYEDTNAEETATILREFFGLTKVEVVPDPSVNNIKNALAQGKVVLVPLAGRQIGNPYYLHPGPLYHMLVIKGYDKNDEFITNDPGTKRGASYLYRTSIIMNAIHDWNGGDVENGRKVMIVVG
jgi:hypothetical protein